MAAFKSKYELACKVLSVNPISIQNKQCKFYLLSLLRNRFTAQKMRHVYPHYGVLCVSAMLEKYYHNVE
jgi:hypothetical protein